jgi:hypothetical protein
LFPLKRPPHSQNSDIIILCNFIFKNHNAHQLSKRRRTIIEITVGDDELKKKRISFKVAINLLCDFYNLTRFRRSLDATSILGEGFRKFVVMVRAYAYCNFRERMQCESVDIKNKLL